MYWLITFWFLVSIKHSHKEHEIHTKAVLAIKELDWSGTNDYNYPQERSGQKDKEKQSSTTTIHLPFH